MRRGFPFMLALLFLAAALLFPGTASALDELKNEDPEKYYIVLDLNNQIVHVYEKDEFGEYTKVVRRFLCSTGRAQADEGDPEDVATPTPRGVWKIGGRERFGKFANFSGEYARYWTQIVGSIFFHSIMFSRRDVNALQRSAFSNLGHAVSHGCVRLYVEDARWLYYYACPGTTINVTNDLPTDRSLQKALKTGMSFSKYNAFQKRITDGEPLPNARAWVTVDGARLRKGSGASFASVGKLDVGDELEILMQGEVWVKVKFGKREGYVKRGYLSYIENEMDTSRDADLVKTTEWIYASPDMTTANRLCKVPAQTSVKVLEVNGEAGWTKIAYHNETGYLKSSRMTKGWGEIMG